MRRADHVGEKWNHIGSPLLRYRGLDFAVDVSAAELRIQAIVPKISALIHASNDARRIGRVLDSLRACDEVLVIDHDSGDDTAKIAREHGANVKRSIPGVANGAYALDARHEWIFCVRPAEAVTEELEASLHRWKDDDHEAPAFRVSIRQETGSGWKQLPAETRLVNRNRLNWTGELPPDQPTSSVLQGDLLRFTLP